MKPLNGEKTHPLTDKALLALRQLKYEPIASQEFNPGITNRLLREHLVEQVQLPSPYASHKGKNIEHLRITGAGRKAIE